MRWVRVLYSGVVPVLFAVACSGRTTTNGDGTSDEPCAEDCDGSSTGGAGSVSGSTSTSAGDTASSGGGGPGAAGTCDTAGTYRCFDNTLYVCVDDAGEWTQLIACGSDQLCQDETGGCLGMLDRGAGGGPTTSTATSTTGFVSPCNVDAAFYSCQGSVCHGTPGIASSVVLGGGLDLFLPDRETSLVNRPATYSGVADMTDCPLDDPEFIIDSESPEQSLIIKKIMGTQSCGAMEPLVGTLADADRQCIVDWVTAVAQAARERGL